MTRETMEGGKGLFSHRRDCACVPCSYMRFLEEKAEEERKPFRFKVCDKEFPAIRVNLEKL